MKTIPAAFLGFLCSISVGFSQERLQDIFPTEQTDPTGKVLQTTHLSVDECQLVFRVALGTDSYNQAISSRTIQPRYIEAKPERVFVFSDNKYTNSTGILWFLDEEVLNSLRQRNEAFMSAYEEEFGPIPSIAQRLSEVDYFEATQRLIERISLGELGEERQGRARQQYPRGVEMGQYHPLTTLGIIVFVENHKKDRVISMMNEFKMSNCLE